LEKTYDDTLVVNFTNFLRKAFTRTDHKSAKIQANCQFFFALLESVCLKASSKMLVKSTPGSSLHCAETHIDNLASGVNFINILCKKNFV